MFGAHQLAVDTVNPNIPCCWFCHLPHEVSYVVSSPSSPMLYCQTKSAWFGRNKYSFTSHYPMPTYFFVNLSPVRVCQWDHRCPKHSKVMLPLVGYTALNYWIIRPHLMLATRLVFPHNSFVTGTMQHSGRVIRNESSKCILFGIYKGLFTCCMHALCFGDLILRIVQWHLYDTGTIKEPWFSHPIRQ